MGQLPMGQSPATPAAAGELAEPTAQPTTV
jgi:hypothetical protein